MIFNSSFKKCLPQSQPSNALATNVIDYAQNYNGLNNLDAVQKGLNYFNTYDTTLATLDTTTSVDQEVIYHSASAAGQNATDAQMMRNLAIQDNYLNTSEGLNVKLNAAQRQSAQNQTIVTDLMNNRGSYQYYDLLREGAIELPVTSSKQGMYDLTKGYINSSNSDDFGGAISWGSAISDATKDGAFGVGKGHANYVLGKAGTLHQVKINGILNASSLDEAANLFSSPNGRTASLLTDYSKVVKGAAIAGPLLDLAEFGVDIYQDSSTPRAVIATTVATEVNLLGAYGSAVVGAKLGFEVGAGLSLIPVVTPFAPVVIPVTTGLGAAGGYLAYELTGASDWVKDNTKAVFNSLIDATKSAPKPW